MEYTKEQIDEIEQAYQELQREQILKPMRENLKKYSDIGATYYAEAVEDLERIVKEIYPDVINN